MKKEEILKDLLASTDRLERVLANLDSLKDDDGGSILLHTAFYTKTIQLSDLFDVEAVEEGCIRVKEWRENLDFVWGVTTRTEGPLAGKAFLLNEEFDWELGGDKDSRLCLVPIKKK